VKHISCIKPGQLMFGEEPIPVAGQGETLVKILKIGVCGTDLHAVEGTQPFFTYPRILGHELACEIIDDDEAGSLKAGQHATVVPYFSCGSCHMCESGRPNACIRLRVCGVHIDGGMREYFNVPTANLIVSGLSPDQLALVEPLSVGAHAVRRAPIKERDDVIVIGAGPIGIATILYAALAGANVVAVDVNPWRLECCGPHRWPDAFNCF
jgi:threonine dehydrogenase-like Zn-dependent dehydrogenase